VRQPHATDDRGLHRVVFLALLPLRLASTPDSAAGTTEGACRSAALTWATTTATAAATGTTAEATGGSTATGTGTSACTGTAATAAVVTAAGTAAGAAAW
jgi:hypothetical protein